MFDTDTGYTLSETVSCGVFTVNLNCTVISVIRVHPEGLYKGFRFKHNHILIS